MLDWVGRVFVERIETVSVTVKYVVFETSWGYFALAGTTTGLVRTLLPVASFGRARADVLKSFPNAQYDPELLGELQEQIAAYFRGEKVEFEQCPRVVLAGLSPFAKSVLRACREVKYGQTITYGRLAKTVGRPAAARAVGAVLAGNPLPLVIPCHRVIRSDGNTGGFSAAGGVALKKRLLALEKACLRCLAACSS